MQGHSILNEIFSRLINTELMTQVYHSVIIREVDGIRKPIAPVKGGYEYVGVQDEAGFTAYCRATGPLEIESTINVGSCQANIIRATIPHKLVFFNDHEERNHDDITGKLIQAVLGVGGVRFQRAITIPEQILSTEAGGRFTFTPATYYTAIDFSILLRLQADECAQEFGCGGFPNPFCQ